MWKELIIMAQRSDQQQNVFDFQKIQSREELYSLFGTGGTYESHVYCCTIKQQE
jgi:hypothetical protein